MESILRAASRCYEIVCRSTGRDLVSYVESYKGLVEAFACALQLLPCIIVIDSIDNFATTMGEDIGSIKGDTVGLYV